MNAEDSDTSRKVRTDPLREKITCVGIGRSDSNEVCVLDTRDCAVSLPAMRALQDFLGDPDRIKCFHNGSFDTAVLEARFSGLEAQSIEFQLMNREPVFRVRGYKQDTMVLSKNIWPDVSKGAKGDEVGIPLDWVANAYTDTRPWKPKQKAAKKKGGRPVFDSFEQLALYNARDVKSTMDSLYALWDEAMFQKIRPEQVALDVQLQTVAVDMQRIGLPINAERVAEIEGKCREQVTAHSITFAELAERPLCSAEHPDGLKLDSPKQLETILFDVWKLPPSKMNKGRGVIGAPTRSTAFDVLQGLAGHPGVDALLEIRRLGQIIKLTGSWKHMVRDGFLHPSWRAGATVTGRFSSKPNAQNWPNNIKGVGNMRGIVKAPPGWLLVGSDYAALEQRIMGALTGAKLFAFVNKPDDDSRKFDPDYDCHSHVARKVFGGRFTNPELFFEPGKYEPGEALLKAIANQRKVLRNDTKRVVYARNYGSGVDTIWAIVKEEDPKCPSDKIDDIIRAYDQLFPELPKYRERAHAEAQVRRALFSALLGRRRAFPFGEIALTDAANFSIQSSASDIVNLRTVALLAELPSDAHLILQGHDSLTVMCREHKADAVKALMNQILPCRYDLGHGEMFFDARAQVGESWDKT
jgi:DNA polymerase I-like protein with 3'-5' exonuclease and polymerase domains